jgi:hypothetical protein
MTRPAPFIAAARGENVIPFLAAELMYPRGPVRVTTLDRVVNLISPETGLLVPFYGVGAMGEVGVIEEGGESRSYGFVLTLSGIPNTLLVDGSEQTMSEYLREQDVQGKRYALIFGFMDRLYQVQASDIIQIGRMDTQDVLAGETTAVQLSCESIQVDWERSHPRFYTDVDQQQRHPGDKFCQYMAALENMDLPWGRA